MFPLVHPGVAYVVYAWYGRYRRGEPPSGVEAVGLALAATVPDLIDQPRYHLGLAATTRTVGHSVLAGVVRSLLVIVVVR